jgi:outer membrane receptor for ferrienterochelin and colicins
MVTRRLSLSTFFLFALSWQVLASGGSLAGRVTTKDDAEPLVGVNVLLLGTVRGTTTNSRGEFHIPEVPAGRYTLVFSMVGYHREKRSDVDVVDGKETLLTLTMNQAPVQTEQIVVTASKREQSLQEVPASISVMEAGEIKVRNSLTIDDALRYIPGVNITGSQVNVRGSSGYSRGAGSRVLMLLDGIPFITGDTGELNFESIPVGQVDRIEVVKGASSALYGSSALGGVINIITKPISEIPETDVRTYGGFYNWPSFGEWQWSDKRRWFNGQSISHARKVGDLGMVFFFSRQRDDGYRLNDYHRRYNFYLKAREDFSPSGSMTLNFGLLDQYGGQFLYWRNLDSALIPPLRQQNDNVKSMRYYVSGTYKDVLSDNIFFAAKALWYHNDWGVETFQGYGRAESLSDGFRVEALSTVILDKVHTLTLGLDGNMDFIGGDIFGDQAIGGFATYGQDEIKLLEELSLTVGARFDYQTIGINETTGKLNPKVGLAYTPVAGTSLRASYGQGFRVPSVAEAFVSAGTSGVLAVPNKDLKPERSSSYEVGLSQILGNVGSFDIAAFRSDFDNMIEPGLAIANQDLQIQWRNVTQARVAGIETSFKLGLFDGGLMYAFGYTYVYPQDRTKHDLLKYRPRHLFYTSLLTRVGMFSAGADFRYLSRVDRIDDELVDVGIIPDGDVRGDISVTDFRIGADLSFTGIPLAATLNVNNALQWNYVELIGNMMPPRTYVLVLEAKL